MTKSNTGGSVGPASEPDSTGTGIYDASGRYLGKTLQNTSLLRMKNGVITSKRCASCLEFFPIKEFPFRKKSKRYGEYCHNCLAEVNHRQWKRRSKNKSKKTFRARKRDGDGLLMWRCGRCGEFKYEADYYKNHTREFRETIRTNCIRCENQMDKERKSKKNG
jgi:hypothetical protein